MRLILLTDGSSAKREFRLTRWKIAAYVFAAALAMGATTYSASRFISRWMTSLAMSEVENENLELHRQIDQIEDRLAEVDRQMTELFASDDRLRIIADLPKIDPDVRQVGVGGVISDYDLLSDNGSVQKVMLDLDKIERELKLQRESFLEIERQLIQKADLVAHIPSIRPVNGGFISSGFGYRIDPFTGRKAHHDGIDISVERGTPIYATADGKVVFAKRAPGFGKMVVIDNGYGFETVYGHMSKILVRKGQSVERWQKIGEVGNTGRSTAPHLHYEVRVDKKPVDPMEYIFNNFALQLGR